MQLFIKRRAAPRGLGGVAAADGPLPAWTLLLRHPETFGRAAAWDAPLMMDELGLYGTRAIFGTQAQFEQYRPADLLRKTAARLRDSKRLILTGYGNFREHHERAHALAQ